MLWHRLRFHATVFHNSTFHIHSTLRLLDNSQSGLRITIICDAFGITSNAIELSHQALRQLEFLLRFKISPYLIISRRNVVNDSHHHNSRRRCHHHLSSYCLSIEYCEIYTGNIQYRITCNEHIRFIAGNILYTVHSVQYLQ